MVVPIEKTNLNSKNYGSIKLSVFDYYKIYLASIDYTCFLTLYKIIKENVTDYRRTEYGNVRYNYY